MNHRSLLLFTLLACRPAAPAPAPPTECTDLAWLAGRWRARDGDGLTEERWTAAADGALVGVGRTLVAGRTTFFEDLRIEPRADGLVFIARPSGGPPVEFRQVACDPADLRFANPAHDFPQQIRYRRLSDGSLETSIAGGGTGRTLVLERSGP